MSQTRSIKHKHRSVKPASRHTIAVARGAKPLGLRIRNTGELIQRVQEGFSIDRLAKLGRYIGMPREQLATLVEISPRTLARRQDEGHLKPAESDRLLRLSRIIDMAVELFEGDAEAALNWLSTPNRGLDGKQPIKFASTDLGAREVENLIGRLEYGIVA